MNSTNGQHESNELLKQILNVNEETLTLQRLQFKLFEEEVKGLKKQMGGIDKRMGSIEQKMGNIEQILVQNTEAINFLVKEMRTLRNDFTKMFDYMQTNHSKLEERLKRVEDKVFLG